MKLLAALLIAFATIHSQIEIKEQIIDSGILYKKIINADDTLSVDILKVDLSKSNYIIKSVKAKNLLGARKTTSDMAEEFSDSGYNVIAAINADFFEDDGEVVNNMIYEGEFVKAVKFTDSPFNDFVNTQFAITFENRPLIEQFVFSGSLIFPDGTIENLNRINSRADSNSIMLYNKFQGTETPTAPEDWNVLETVLLPLLEFGDTLFFTVGDEFKQGGNRQIPENGFIISANNQYSFYLERNLSIGDTVKILLKLNPYYPKIRSLTGGWPLLVKDGENVIQSNPNKEGVISRFSENRHPRTGIGFSQDSTIVYFLTVDGRQRHSRGMSLLEFADLMIQEGIYHGLNLDGGGSTVMIVNDKVVNSPSDFMGERAVGNCLLLIKE